MVEHLESHLERLPENDDVSRAIIMQMAEDEARHADMAVENGAAELPDFIKQAMKVTAGFMTRLSERI